MKIQVLNVSLLDSNHHLQFFADLGGMLRSECSSDLLFLLRVGCINFWPLSASLFLLRSYSLPGQPKDMQGNDAWFFADIVMQQLGLP